MASVASDPGGRKRVQFVGPGGTRKTIRLGKTSEKNAEAVARHVEELLAAKISGQPVGRQTAVWLAEIGEGLRDKLAAVGLVEGERRTTVAEYLARWLKGKEDSGFSPNSIRAWGQTVAEMTDLLGGKRLAQLTRADGERYRQAMLDRGLRPTTVHKRLAHARAMMASAIKDGEATANPFEHVNQRQGDPSERRAYIPVADVERVIERCPNVWWRLLVALARFGGLRTPSEPLELTWGDVDWENDRLTVTSPKTASKGKPYRVIPLFALLKPHLEAAWEAAEEGAVEVFPEQFRGRTNLRTQLTKLVRRAGLEPWPRIWHSLRASCESDLATTFPLATVTRWLGNTPSVALRHYIDPTDASFEQARGWRPGGAESGARTAQNAAQQVPASSRTTSQEGGATPLGVGVFAESCENLRELANEQELLERECIGIESSQDSRQKTDISQGGGAISGALAELLRLLRSDPLIASRLDPAQRVEAARMLLAGVDDGGISRTGLDED